MDSLGSSSGGDVGVESSIPVFSRHADVRMTELILNSCKLRRKRKRKILHKMKIENAVNSERMMDKIIGIHNYEMCIME